MVAISGHDWQLAPSLIAMVREADALAPDRSTGSDGSIGDRSHQSRESDHNPSDGYVHALDLTHDPAGGLDVHDLARDVIARRDPRVKYVISAGEIAASYHRDHRPAWTWAPYGGANPHDRHAHFSILHDPAARGNTTPWWPQQKGIPMSGNVAVIISPSDEVTRAYNEAGHKGDEAGRAYWRWKIAVAAAEEGLGGALDVVNYMRAGDDDNPMLGLDPIRL